MHCGVLHCPCRQWMGLSNLAVVACSTSQQNCGCWKLCNNHPLNCHSSMDKSTKWNLAWVKLALIHPQMPFELQQGSNGNVVCSWICHIAGLPCHLGPKENHHSDCSAHECMICQGTLHIFALLQAKVDYWRTPSDIGEGAPHDWWTKPHCQFFSLFCSDSFTTTYGHSGMHFAMLSSCILLHSLLLWCILVGVESPTLVVLWLFVVCSDKIARSRELQ